jgi:hypothetical protein
MSVRIGGVGCAIVKTMIAEGCLEHLRSVGAPGYRGGDR